MKKILVLASHPDDELLGCGGTLARYGQTGAQVKILFIGEGSTCRYDDPAEPNALRDREVRNSCAIEALKVVGVTDYVFVDFPCGRFDQIPIIEINKVIEKQIKEFKPDTVFTHSDIDSNNDHRIVHRSSIMATRPCGPHVVKRLYSYEVLSSSEWSYSKSFSPNYFVKLSKEQLLLKWEALECYKSEVREYPFPRSWLGVENLAMQRGMQAGAEFAEGFQLIRGFD